MGSSRDVTPPWGGDKRLGDRVLKHVVNHIKTRREKIGEVKIKHEVTVYDPLVVFGKGGAIEDSGAGIRTPHFFLAADKVSVEFAAMAATIKAADAYVIVTPEYNHSIPPALSGLMGHFGGSNYAYKPSAIVTYSPSPWGGMRVAMALRPMLAELGCVSVSKLTAFPDPGSLFKEDGTPTDPEARMLKQLPAMMTSLEWTAVAFANMREANGTPT